MRNATRSPREGAKRLLGCEEQDDEDGVLIRDFSYATRSPIEGAK